MSTISPDKIHEVVRNTYGQIATEFKPDVLASCCSPAAAVDEGSCCESDESQAEALFKNLYSADIGWLPEDVTGLSLGCGDPITLAALESGQTVLDLGSGGGIDCFMAARQVGELGHVIGVDMTPAMIEMANKNKQKVGLDNVEFRLGRIEKLPVDNSTVDVIISNCVINLAPNKTAVFQEAFRVLKPNGRIAASDMVTMGHFSEEDRANMISWTGCIAGAENVADYVAAIKAAGFTDISIRDKSSPEVELVGKINEKSSVEVISARVTAVKP